MTRTRFGEWTRRRSFAFTMATLVGLLFSAEPSTDIKNADDQLESQDDGIKKGKRQQLTMDKTQWTDARQHLSQWKSQVFHGLQEVRWMNPRPANNEAYVPTGVEHVANIVTHGLFVFPVVLMGREMLASAENDLEVWVAVIYGLALAGLFLTSTIFHTISYFWHQSYLKELFHRGDRAMIYLFIAGSYTPWLCLKEFPDDGWSHHLRPSVWILAFLGITYQQMFHERYKMLETCFYIFIGLVPALAVFEMEDTSGIDELKYGGVAYLTGVVFFKSDGVIPFAHAIWHLHVVIGSMLHYYAVSTYLIDG